MVEFDLLTTSLATPTQRDARAGKDLQKQVTKTTPTHPDVHTDRPTHSYTLRYTPGLPPAHRRQLSLCAHTHPDALERNEDDTR